MGRTSRHGKLVVSALVLALIALACDGDDDGDADDSGSNRIDASRTEDAATSADAHASSSANLIGGACDANDDCGAGTCQKTIPVVNTPYPGGYCTASCRTSAECGAEGVCVPGLRGQTGSCYLGCDEAAGCSRAGYLCRVADGVARCVPGS